MVASAVDSITQPSTHSAEEHRPCEQDVQIKGQLARAIDALQSKSGGDVASVPAQPLAEVFQVERSEPSSARPPPPVVRAGSAMEELADAISALHSGELVNRRAAPRGPCRAPRAQQMQQTHQVQQAQQVPQEPKASPILVASPGKSGGGKVNSADSSGFGASPTGGGSLSAGEMIKPEQSGKGFVGLLQGSASGRAPVDLDSD